MMPMRPVILLTCQHRHRQAVLLRRQRTRRIRCYRAWRIVSTVEIENHLAIYHRIAVQKSSTGISISLAAQIPDHETESLRGIAAQGRKREVLPIELETDFTSNRCRCDIAEDVGYIDRLLTMGRNESPSNPVSHIKREENWSGIIARSFTIQIFHPDPEPLATLNEVHAQAAHFYHGCIAGHISLQLGLAGRFAFNFRRRAFLDFDRNTVALQLKRTRVCRPRWKNDRIVAGRAKCVRARFQPEQAC